MMHAVRGHPENRTAFQRQGAEGRENVFQPQRNLVRPVRVQTVVAHADAEADRNVVKHGRHGQSLPTEHEEGGHGPHMKEHQKICGEAVQPLALCQLGDVFSFHCFPSYRRSFITVSRGGSTLCKTSVIPTGWRRYFRLCGAHCGARHGRRPTSKSRLNGAVRGTGGGLTSVSPRRNPRQIGMSRGGFTPYPWNWSHAPPQMFSWKCPVTLRSRHRTRGRGTGGDSRLQKMPTARVERDSGIMRFGV